MKLDLYVALLAIGVSIVTSLTTVLISILVFKATASLKITTLQTEFADFKTTAKEDSKEIHTKLNEVALKQQAKITSIISLEEKFDQFRSDHIREIGGVSETLRDNTKAINELTGTLSVLKEFIKHNNNTQTTNH